MTAAAAADTPTRPTIDLGIDLAAFIPEQSLSLADACAQILRGKKGKRLHVEVARRWATAGLAPHGPDGPLLMLPAVKWGGGWQTMPEWARAFEAKRVELATRGRAVERAELPVRSPAKREREQKRATAELDRELNRRPKKSR